MGVNDIRLNFVNAGNQSIPYAPGFTAVHITANDGLPNLIAQQGPGFLAALRDQNGVSLAARQGRLNAGQPLLNPGEYLLVPDQIVERVKSNLLSRASVDPYANNAYERLSDSQQAIAYLQQQLSMQSGYGVNQAPQDDGTADMLRMFAMQNMMQTTNYQNNPGMWGSMGNGMDGSLMGAGQGFLPTMMMMMQAMGGGSGNMNSLLPLMMMGQNGGNPDMQKMLPMMMMLNQGEGNNFDEMLPLVAMAGGGNQDMLRLMMTQKMMSGQGGDMEKMLPLMLFSGPEGGGEFLKMLLMQVVGKAMQGDKTAEAGTATPAPVWNERLPGGQDPLTGGRTGLAGQVANPFLSPPANLDPLNSNLGFMGGKISPTEFGTAIRQGSRNDQFVILTPDANGGLTPKVISRAANPQEFAEVEQFLDGPHPGGGNVFIVNDENNPAVITPSDPRHAQLNAAMGAVDGSGIPETMLPESAVGLSPQEADYGTLRDALAPYAAEIQASGNPALINLFSKLQRGQPITAAELATVDPALADPAQRQQALQGTGTGTATPDELAANSLMVRRPGLFAAKGIGKFFTERGLRSAGIAAGAHGAIAKLGATGGKVSVAAVEKAITAAGAKATGTNVLTQAAQKATKTIKSAKAGQVISTLTRTRVETRLVKASEVLANGTRTLSKKEMLKKTEEVIRTTGLATKIGTKGAAKVAITAGERAVESAVGLAARKAGKFTINAGLKSQTLATKLAGQGIMAALKSGGWKAGARALAKGLPIVGNVVNAGFAVYSTARIPFDWATWDDKEKAANLGYAASQWGGVFIPAVGLAGDVAKVGFDFTHDHEGGGEVPQN